MVLSDEDIINLLRGDLSDIEEFDDTDNESEILKAFEDMDILVC